jgi:D-glycero-alpha-D-manno-heptose-7-phosphate kinase
VDLARLERRLLLVYTGAPRNSGATNWSAMRAYLDGEPATVAALHEIAEIARRVRERLRAGDLDGALAAVVEEGRVRRRLYPGIATETTDLLDRRVREAGALGTKILGAGGGGCLLVVRAEGQTEDTLVRALDAPGCVRLPLRLATRGLVLAASPREA